MTLAFVFVLSYGMFWKFASISCESDFVEYWLSSYECLKDERWKITIPYYYALCIPKRSKNSNCDKSSLFGPFSNYSDSKKNGLSDIASVILTQTLNHASVDLPRSMENYLLSIVENNSLTEVIDNGLKIDISTAFWHLKRLFKLDTRVSHSLFRNSTSFYWDFLTVTPQRVAILGHNLQAMVNLSFMIASEVNEAKNKLVNIQNPWLKQSGLAVLFWNCRGIVRFEIPLADETIIAN